MANSKISALPSAATVAGAEVLPIVQSSVTVKVAISDLNPGLSTILATKGGTGQTSYAVGDLLYADTTTTLAKLADVATGNALISGGVSTAPSYGKIGLATHVSGTLPVANGGTATSTAFTTGSVVFAGASGVYSQNNTNFFWDNTNNRLGVGTTAPSGVIAASQLSTGSPVTGLVLGNTGLTSGSTIRLNFISGEDGTVGRTRALIEATSPAANDGGLVLYTRSAGSTAAKLSIGASDVTVNTGNVVIGTSGKGIDFSATAGTGTSELLADYEEGTWTPAFTSLTVVGTATFVGTYTKVGRLLYWKAKVSTTGTTASVAGTTFINNLPFALGPDRPTFIAQAADFVGCNAVGWVVSQTQARTPTWSANAFDIYLSGCYETT